MTPPGEWLGIILPIGISFYTFQAIGYLIDVHVGNVQAERRPARFAAFISFFPQLMAGPIERARHFMPQLDQIGEFNYERVVSGLRAILLGMFLKVVIADNLAPLVDGVYAAPQNHHATDLLLATVYFSFQVYADFAGYSLIAIGSGRLLGVELLQNFRQPFLSRTVPEYWRTWHMSLSSWVRDYVFTPLQFQWRRYGVLGLAAALIITFVVLGIWHGVGWKYVLFGIAHGVLVTVSTLSLKARDRFWQRYGVPSAVVSVCRMLLTFSVVTLTFVLFRANEVRDALWIYGKLISGPVTAPGLPTLWPFALIVLVLAGDVMARSGWAVSQLRTPARWATYNVALTSIAALTLYKFLEGSPHVQQFIYFKF